MPFNLTTFSAINKCVTMNISFEASSIRKPEIVVSVRAVLGSCGLDKLNSFQDNADGHGDFLNSCNSSQLEQNKAQANIREVKQNKVASSPVSIALHGVAEVHSGSWQKGCGHFISRS